MEIEDTHVSTQGKTLLLHDKALQIVLTVFGITSSPATDELTRVPEGQHAHTVT